jgi:hypothetical protein
MLCNIGLWGECYKHFQHRNLFLIVISYSCYSVHVSMQCEYYKENIFHYGISYGCNCYTTLAFGANVVNILSIIIYIMVEYADVDTLCMLQVTLCIIPG